MPDPRSLGNVALVIGEWIIDQNLKDLSDFLAIVRCAANSDFDGIIAVATLGAERNMTEFQVVNYFVNSNFGKAQDRIIDYTLAQKSVEQESRSAS